MGYVNIDVSSDFSTFHLEIDKRINFIRGDSGSGKTYLCDTLADSKRESSEVSVVVSGAVSDYDVLTDYRVVSNYTDAVLVFDEVEVSSEFADMIANLAVSNNLFFILITREAYDISSDDTDIFSLVSPSKGHYELELLA